ncbi:uncharacterized protein LOC136092768 [Hydra vulgaris]|uniref:uncharacterized protein LOC136092768 n=1 Tax=Hydra vulgaris TaxID=6087 RepID=UPI0032EA2FC4
MSPLEHFIALINEENLIRFLQNNQLIDSQKVCECEHNMNIQKFNRCKRCCKCKKTIRSGFFENSTSLTVAVILQLMFLWIVEIPVTASVIVGVCAKTSVQWYQYFREVCTFKIIDLPNTVQLGGPGHIVEMDESLMFKRKNNVRHVVEKHWIFGAYDLTSKKGYLRRVPDRTAETLMPLIVTWVAPGSTIHLDQWASYNTLNNLGYDHLTVNHTTNFVDPLIHATTNHVESFWSRIKCRLKFVCGSQVAYGMNENIPFNKSKNDVLANIILEGKCMFLQQNVIATM